MKRFHVHVAVSNLEQSTRFYSAMFGALPTVEKGDYAKWMLDDPRINFAISQRANAPGLNHLGVQAENSEELEQIHARLQTADTVIAAEKGANCCYAKSDKYWVQDPSGIAWESFHSLDGIPFYGEQNQPRSTMDSTDALAKDAGSAGCSITCCPTTIQSSPVTTEAINTTNAIKPTEKACCNG